MDSLFQYVAGAFAIIFVALGALLLFPFFPMLALCFVVACMFVAAALSSFTPDFTPETETENGVEQMEA